jgi:hypothetical protein
MRSKELKINDKTYTAILMAGGKGFKIYFISGFSDWVIQKNKKIYVIDDTENKTVSRYVNLKYHNANEKKEIITNFDNFLKELEESL